MHMPIPAEWLARLNLGLRLGKDLIVASEQAVAHPCAHILQDALDAGVSGILCVDGSPSAAIVAMSQSEEASQQELRTLYQILWNQGELDFLLLLRADLVEVHSLRATPEQWAEGDASPTFLAALDVIKHAEDIESLVSGIESGRLLSENIATFAIDTRVDATLINDLDGVRKCLLVGEGYINYEDAPQELIAKIHDVLLQAMFLLYLSDREIIGTSYIQAHSNQTTETLHDLLRYYPQSFSCLLRRLDVDFNGGLFTPNDLWQSHAQTMAYFLEGMCSFPDMRPRLLRVYRFDHIPVELLSEVYDRFLHSEGSKKAHGAYYTPRRLAALVVEQAWEGIKAQIDTGHIPKILDPACGSGIFLASLFQRMAGYLLTPSWDDLKQLATCLHGLDINETAIRISAFSLSLALLNRRRPKDLQESIANEGKVLPELLGKTLLKSNFFDHPTDEQYDCVIGNPPWGCSKQRMKTKEELWVIANEYPEPPQRERAWPFIWKSLTHLPANGTLILLLPSTGFFLNDVKLSLNRLIDFVRIDRLIDLSDLRHVLFKSAIFPACIACATRESKKTLHSFVYMCPKADLNAVRNDRILIAQEDIHQLSAQHFANDSVAATQRLMWASPLERKLLMFLDTLPTLRDLPLLETRQARKLFPKDSRPDWGMGLGFQAYTGKNKELETKGRSPRKIPELAYLPYVTVKNLVPWVYPISSGKTYGEEDVLWKNYEEGFIAPHIVMPLSIRNSRLNASYSEHSQSFNKSLMGITVPDSYEGKTSGKLLTAYLNSTFTGWYLGTLGLAVDRPKLDCSDILPLPFPSPDDLPNSEQAQKARDAIVRAMDSLMDQAKKLQRETFKIHGEFPTAVDIKTLDNLIFSYFGLRPEEISAINENVNLIREAAQKAKGSKPPTLWQESQKRHWDSYCKWLANALTAYMCEDMQTIASPYACSKDIVVVRLTRQKRQHPTQPPNVEQQEIIPLYKLQKGLLKTLEKPLTGNIYLQRCAMIFTEQEIYLLKPRQRRFWLTAAAYADADRIMGHLLQAADTVGEVND